MTRCLAKLEHMKRITSMEEVGKNYIEPWDVYMCNIHTGLERYVCWELERLLFGKVKAQNLYSVIAALIQEEVQWKS